MNQEKAREFFSAYYEGSLEPGLVMTLEQKFKSDPSLKLDYDAFVSAYEQLDAFKTEEIEIPIFLSDRIATRLDEVHLAKKTSIFAWHWNWRSMAAAGMAAVAILGAGLGILNREHGPSTGGFLPWLWHSKGAVNSPSNSIDAPTFKVSGAQVVVSYQPQGAHTVTVSVGLTRSSVTRTINLESGQPVDSPLLNKNAKAQLFTIQEDQSLDQELVAVPGTEVDSSAAQGEGTLGQFACAIADAYHVPVLVESSKAGERLTWNFDAVKQEALKSATDNLSSLHLNIGLRGDGMLTIQDR